MAFVLDTSVTMAWFLDGEATPYSEAALTRLRESGATVPAIWTFEVANTLLMGERRQRITKMQTLRAIQLLQALPIVVDGDSLTAAWGVVLMVGRDQGLTAYDAAYLELAAREGLPLATQDSRLREAASRIGVALA